MWTQRDSGVLAYVPNADALVRSQRAMYEGLGRIVQDVQIRFRSGAGLIETRPAGAAGHSWSCSGAIVRRGGRGLDLLILIQIFAVQCCRARGHQRQVQRGARALFGAQDKPFEQRTDAGSASAGRRLVATTPGAGS